MFQLITHEEVMGMTIKELNTKLNECLTEVTYKSEYPEYVREKMIDKLRTVLPYEIRVTRTFYTEFAFVLSSFSISVKVGVKGTGKNKSVTKLRKREVKQAGLFKICSVASAYFFLPCFKHIGNGVVEVDPSSRVYGDSIFLEDSKGTFREMFDSANLKAKYEKQINDKENTGKGVFEEIVLHAAQDMIKAESFKKDGWNQETFDRCLKITAERNADLFNSVIEKMFTT